MLPLRITLTNVCNNRCVFCSMDFQDRTGSHFIDSEWLIGCLGTFKELGGNKIYITGGEPTLHPQIKDILKSSKELGLETRITTNGTMQPNFWEGGGKWLPQRINFSLHSLDADEFRAVARSEFTPSDVLKNIEKAKTLGVDVEINIVYVSKNLLSIDYKRFISQLKAMDISFCFMNDMMQGEGYYQEYLSAMRDLEIPEPNYKKLRNSGFSVCSGCGYRNNCASCDVIWVFSSSLISPCSMCREMKHLIAPVELSLREKLVFANGLARGKIIGGVK